VRSRYAPIDIAPWWDSALRLGPFGLSDNGCSRNQCCPRRGPEFAASRGIRRQTPSGSNQKPIRLAETGGSSRSADSHRRSFLIRRDRLRPCLSSVGRPREQSATASAARCPRLAATLSSRFGQGHAAPTSSLAWPNCRLFGSAVRSQMRAKRGPQPEPKQLDPRSGGGGMSRLASDVFRQSPFDNTRRQSRQQRFWHSPSVIKGAD
jgi:hypothetical protein